MYKNCYTFCGFLVVLLLSAPFAWAQPVLRHMPKNPQILAAKRVPLRKVYPRTVHIPAAKRVPLYPFMASPEAIAERIERQLVLKHLNDKNRAKILATKTAQAFAKKEEEKILAMNTPLGMPNTTSQTGDVLFRGVKIGELHPQEYLFMAVAYNQYGHQVAALRTSSINGKPVSIGNLDYGLLAYDITRVLAAIRVPATETSPKQLRIIDYDLSTGTVKTVIK